MALVERAFDKLCLPEGVWSEQKKKRDTTIEEIDDKIRAKLGMPGSQ